MPPTLQHRRLAYALVVVTLAAYATVPPFATIQLPRVDGFVLSASSDTHYGGARFEITLPTKNRGALRPGGCNGTKPSVRMSH